MLKKILLGLQIVSIGVVFGQTKAPNNWFNLDATTDKVVGMSTEKAYDLLKGKTSKTVIVAVLDSGVDINHEDLKSIIWVNAKEIPNNGIDDDKNGYIDDVNGWSFLGGKNGDVAYDNKEYVRQYARLQPKYDKLSEEEVKKLSKTEKAEYQLYTKYKGKFVTEKMQMGQTYQMYGAILQALESVIKDFAGKELNATTLQDYKTEDEIKKVAVGVLLKELKEGKSVEDTKKEVKEGVDYLEKQVKYYLNTEYNSRSIVGDDYANQTEKNYGNNNVTGPNASHGTHVAGIIAAIRTNNLGIKGVADNVRIMPVRVVPEGDERDKDVANAIRYAVDNGASIINMSFGKDASFNKKVVDDAVQYAVSKDVLLVHAAGNSSLNLDEESNFPNKRYEAGKMAASWLEVGASSWKGETSKVGEFSNYGKKNVDVFAPGVDIYSTTPGSKYDSYNGTSMASPATAGVAALIRSYFPQLTAVQVKEIMMKSVNKIENTTLLPGSEDKQVAFKELCNTGGVVNAYQAVLLASKTKGKKK